MSGLSNDIQPVSHQTSTHLADEKLDETVDTVLHKHDATNAALIKEDAISAEASERDMTPLEAFKAYPQSIFWSFCVSLCLIMEGYDTTLLGNLLALSTFRKHFGHHAKSSYQLDPAWQSAIGYAPTIGAFCGILISSYFQDRFGYRRTIQVNLALLTGFIFIVFFATSIEMLFIGELLCGLPWGAFSTSAVSYASEVTPIALRAYLTTYVNLCWVIGQIIGSGVIRGVTHRTDQWAYRIPFAIQWIWPIPIFILVTLAPESPWFLVRKGRLEEAKKSIVRLRSKSLDIDPNAVVAMMVRTNEIELNMHAGVSYLDCFRGVDRRRTEIVCVAWASQILTGCSFANHASYFFTQAGLSTVQAVNMDLGMRGVSFVGSVLCWIVMSFFGRRIIVITGASVLCVILLLVGVLGTIAPMHHAAVWGEAGLIILWVFIWDVTVTPVVYAVVGETSSTRLRSKTVGLGRITYNILGIIGGILNTYQQNPLAWGWKGKAGFFWFGSCFLALTWAYFRLPECKGRSFRELDIMFQRNIPARQFKDTMIDAREDE